MSDMTYADRQAALQKAVADRNSKCDRKVRELEKSVGAERTNALKDVQRLEAAALAETEALAVSIAKDEWKVLCPLIGELIESNGKRSIAEELSAEYRRLEERSRSLLPLFRNEPQIVASHRLLYAIAWMCRVTDKGGIEPDCVAFLTTGVDGFNAHYVPGAEVYRSVEREADLITALRDAMPLRIWQDVATLADLCEKLCADETPIPAHFDRKARYDLVRWGGTVEATERKLRALKAVEDQPRNAAAAVESQAHEELMDQRRRGILNLPSLEQVVESTKRVMGIGVVDPYPQPPAPGAE